MYFLKFISDDVTSSQLTFQKQSKTRQLVFGGLFASLAAVLQAAGDLLPGVGYFISPFATAPILICAMLSFPLGVMSYILTNLLLLILQPSELMVFPFTTGLLGLSVGAAFHFFKMRLTIILTGTMVLTLGVNSLLYVFHFPVLGPIVSNSFSFYISGGIFLFSFLYNWILVDVGLFCFRRLKKTKAW
ncbi:hypothetical protein AA0X95_14710 [Bacillus sp. 1P10SD]|uniref:hypothetical protein n=1 Tax=Bacillus sp. 1P10SD TaxID=3132265 RepID=UPI0039A54574